MEDTLAKLSEAFWIKMMLSSSPLISDNASTDNSTEVVKAFSNPRNRLSVNACNVGFAGNLDRVGSMATGRLLSCFPQTISMHSGALRKYQAFFENLGPHAGRSVLSSTWNIIDPKDTKTGVQGPDHHLWTNGDRAPELDSLTDCPVYRVKGEDLLKRCLQQLRNPFNFAATCYPRSLYLQVAGYGANRLVNPDKWFHWKLLSVAETAYFVDAPLFSYRWHPANQTAQELNSGSLKYLIDEYTSTLEFDAALLRRLGTDRETIIHFFSNTMSSIMALRL